ncbi:hypothetical protein, partial [uncultured Alistipes sp.]|uniref:hypothetical protein n=1 Tax=uncultured Alistipes sp. TaxID=538949 RepID=UPI0026E01A4E
EHLTTDQKVTGLSPVGVTEEGESKRLSFLHLGRLSHVWQLFLCPAAGGFQGEIGSLFKPMFKPKIGYEHYPHNRSVHL